MRCEEESALWTTRWAAPRTFTLHALFSYCAPGCQFIRCTELHPILPGCNKSCLHEAYHYSVVLLTLCQRGVDSILWSSMWLLLTNVVDKAYKITCGTNNRQYQYTYFHKGIRLLMHTPHTEDVSCQQKGISDLNQAIPHSSGNTWKPSLLLL